MSFFNKDLHPALSSSPRGRKSNNSMSPPSRKKLNTQTAKTVNLSQNKKTQRHQNSRNGMLSRPQPQNSRRKKWVLNPFRQEDEDKVLVMRNFNLGVRVTCFHKRMQNSSDMLDQTSNRSVEYDRRELFSSLTSWFFKYQFFSSLGCFLNYFQLCQPAICFLSYDIGIRLNK